MSFNYNRTIRSTSSATHTSTYSLSTDRSNYVVGGSSDAWGTALDVVDEALDVLEECSFFVSTDEVDDIDACQFYNV